MTIRFSGAVQISLGQGDQADAQKTTDTLQTVQPGAVLLAPHVITLDVAPSLKDKDSDAKKDKFKSDRKKTTKPSKGSTGLRPDEQDNGDDQAWETEFLVDRAGDSVVPAIPTSYTM